MTLVSLRAKSRLGTSRRGVGRVARARYLSAAFLASFKLCILIREFAQADQDGAWDMEQTDSPYVHILHTNRTSSSQPLVSTSAEIDTIETYLFEVEIARLHSILYGSESENATLLSLIRRIPPELLPRASSDSYMFQMERDRCVYPETMVISKTTHRLP